MKLRLSKLPCRARTQVWALSLLLCLGICLFQAPFKLIWAAPSPNIDLEEQFQEALELHLNSRGEVWIKATDPNERFDSLFSTYQVDILIKQGGFDVLFNAADEAFELEVDRVRGMGSPPTPPVGYPYLPRPIHKGERGGLDGTSCRTCHFSGGPDGGGDGTSLAMFRGDGQHLNTATLRDAPALLGVGYLVLLAQEMSQALQKQKDQAIQRAKSMKENLKLDLSVQGINFGYLVAQANGDIDYSHVEGVSHDLIIRPLGWKGRHHSLVEIADESLALHHGLQSDHRIHKYKDQAESYLGTGPEWDKDQDQVIQELDAGHPAILASYMALLSAPIYTAPQTTSAQLDWAKGRGWFEQVGCAHCHRPVLRVKPAALNISVQGKRSYSTMIRPFEHGQEPRIRRVDYSSDAQGRIPTGSPLFLYSDLKRHDMGEGLADHQDETLPEGQIVPRQLWLTRPLWGLAQSAPYLHDGRAQNIHEAILWHGGEAQSAVELYRNLKPNEQGLLRAFLMSLGRPNVLLVE